MGYGYRKTPSATVKTYRDIAGTHRRGALRLSVGGYRVRRPSLMASTVSRREEYSLLKLRCPGSSGIADPSFLCRWTISISRRSRVI